MQFGEVLKCEINTSRITNPIKIEDTDIDTLYRVLYESGNANLLSCYMPRHGILFSDESGERIGFIELCFECQQSLSTPDVPDFGLTSTAYNELRKLFDKYGF